MNRPNKKQIKDIRKFFSEHNIIEFLEDDTPDNETKVYYIQYNQASNELEAGSVCNVGIIPEVTIEYDASASIWDNFQSLYDAIIESIWGCV